MAKPKNIQKKSFEEKLSIFHNYSERSPLELTIDLLNLDDWYGVSEEIEIAKGKYELQTTFKGAMEQNKRERAWRSRKY